MLNDKVIQPIYEDNAVAVVFCCSELYAPFCAVAIQSIIENVNTERYYDIIILQKELSSEKMDLIERIACDYNNVSIRFFDMSQIFSGYSVAVNGLSIETFFRLMIPDLMHDYAKTVYLDTDVIVACDIAELYDIDVSDVCIAACVEILMAGKINGFDEEGSDYLTSRLKIKNENLFNYFCSGVMVLNNEKIREKHTGKEMLAYAAQNNFRHREQDALNSLFQDFVKILPTEWCCPAFNENTWLYKMMSYAPAEMIEQLSLAKNSAKIIHYVNSRTKPLNDSDYLFVVEFWNICSRTPFCELIFSRYVDTLDKRTNENKKAITDLKNAGERFTALINECNKRLAEQDANYKNQLAQTTNKCNKHIEEHKSLFERRFAELISEYENKLIELKNSNDKHFGYIYSTMEIQQRWMNRVRFSIFYRIARKVRSIFRKSR